jgi:hypothetical protein
VTSPELTAKLRGVASAPALSLDPPAAPRPEVPESSSLQPATEDARELGPARRDLSAVLPPRTALLKVIMERSDDGQDAFQLQGSFEQDVWTSSREDLRHQLRPKMMLSRDLDHTLDSAVNFYGHLLNWSVGKNSLRQWIDRMRAAMGDEARLIIWDDTDFGIPWELFQLHPTGGADTEWLGVAVQVIRWTTVHDPARAGQFSALVTDRSEGGILCYEDAVLAGDPKFNFAALNPGVVPKTTLKDLLTDLADASNRYCLVYVRAHGIHGGSPETATLAGLRLAAFQRWSLPALGKSRAVVFLNACNSATAVYDQDLGDTLFNFAEVFLRQRAGAVIATLAEVPIRPSSGLAGSLLNLARDDGVNIPEFLRLRRARYFAHVWRLVHSKGVPPNAEDLTSEQKRAIQGFIHVSVFAYFGHPEAVLRLEAP